MKKHFYRLCNVMFLITATAGFGQSLSSATHASGSSVSLGAGMVGASFEGIAIEAGTVIEDYLYLGIGWNLQYGQLEGEALQNSIIRALCSVPLISQDEYMPLSFLLTGVFEKFAGESAYLDANELIRTGTGYKAAIDMVKDFTLSEEVKLRLTLAGVYSSGVMITESIAGAASPVTPLQDRYDSYLYGIKAGFLARFNEGVVFGMHFNGQLDENYLFHYGMTFSVTSL